MTTPPFVLDLTVASGRLIEQLPAAEGGIDLREWTSWLRIRSDITGFVPPTFNPDDDELTGFVPPVFEDDGLALLTIVRGADKLPGAAIGLFHARLDPRELEQLRALVEGTPWLDLPRPIGGSVHAPTVTLAYQSGPKLIQRSFSSHSGNFIEAIAPLWQLLEGLAERANKSAASSLELALDVALAPDDPLALTVTVRLRARGIGHVVLNHPLLAMAVGEPPPLRLRIGVQPTDSPYALAHDWVELPMPTLEPGDGPTVILRPNGRLEWSVAWRAPGPGRYRIDASWIDYRGPLEPARGQTPFMPLPQRGDASLGAGPYPIRGALFGAHVIDLG